jgi:hypothetical protein
MLGSPRLRRLGARLGVVAAALASIATSAPEWSLEDSTDEITTRLDTHTPEAAHHFTARSSQAHSARVRGSITWDDAEADPRGAVRIRIVSDSGESAETIRRAPDDTGFELTLSPECSGEPCEQGYTVTLELVDGWPSEHADLAWGFSGWIGGEGMEEPDGAFITVGED